MDNIEAPIYSFFARLSRAWYLPPVRIDIPANALQYLSEVADYCYSTSFFNGIPLAILKADEEVKIGRKFIADVYQEIIGRIERKNGDIKHLSPYWGEAGWVGL
jgi:hypothetical protein